MSTSDILGILSSGGRGVCPKCGGGTGKERCLKVWQYGGNVFAKCYRNSCGQRWKLDARGLEIKPEPKEGPVLQYLIEPTNEKARLVWTRLAGLEGSPKPVRMESKEGLCYPISSPKGVLKGHSVRFYEGKMKSWNYYLDGVPRKELAWFSNTQQASTKPLLIVEDCCSAVLASRHLPTVALMGTELTKECLLDILLNQGGVYNGTVIFALDRDAYTKALLLSRMYASLCPTDVLSLDKDIKDMDDEAIEKLLAPLAEGGGAKRIQ